MHIQTSLKETKEMKKMTNFNDFLKEQKKDPELKKEYDALEPEFAIVQAMIDARKKSGLTQKEQADKTGIAKESQTP